MADWKPFKQIIGYIDSFFQDLGQLTTLIERLMVEKGFESLPSAGNRGTWGITSSFTQPDGWRIRFVSRFYVPIDEDQYRYSLFYLIHLSVQSRFDFPAVICGRMEHDLISENQIYTQVYQTWQIMQLIHKNPPWREFRDERGWTIAEPTYKTLTKKVRGYALNVFDLSGRQQVIDNIVKPLVSDDEEMDLDALLTIPKYPLGDGSGIASHVHKSQ